MAQFPIEVNRDAPWRADGSRMISKSWQTFSGKISRKRIGLRCSDQLERTSIRATHHQGRRFHSAAAPIRAFCMHDHLWDRASEDGIPI
jgi:hypothetical protein